MHVRNVPVSCTFELQGLKSVGKVLQPERSVCPDLKSGDGAYSGYSMMKEPLRVSKVHFAQFLIFTFIEWWWFNLK